MVDELDRGIKTPEMGNASLADGGDCVGQSPEVWALLYSLFSTTECTARLPGHLVPSGSPRLKARRILSQAM